MNKLKKLLENNKSTNKSANKATLKKSHFIFAGLYALQAMILIILNKTVHIPITTNYLAYNPLLSDNGNGQVVHSAGTSLLFELNISWLIITILLLLAVAHLAIATIYKKQYQSGLKANSSIIRWLMYGIVSSSMMIIIAVLSGVYDLSSLILITAVGLFVATFMIFDELRSKDNSKITWFAPFNALKAAIVSWLVIAIYVWGTIVYGGNSIPAYVYWLYFTVLFFQLAFVFMLKQQRKRQSKSADKKYSENTFFVVMFVLQMLVTLQVYFSVLR